MFGIDPHYLGLDISYLAIICKLKMEGTTQDFLQETLLTDDASASHLLGLSEMRWRHVFLYVLAGVANAVVLLTWSPISDMAADYWEISTTLVNALSITFSALYIPGTWVMVKVSAKYDFRGVLLCASLLNGVGVGVRLLGSFIHGESKLASFAVVWLGTAIAALSQPFFLNLPAALASRWFDLTERDTATTVCSLASPLGSAIGSAIPALIVSRKGDDDDGPVTGVSTLLGVQFGVAAVAVLAQYFFFHAYPPVPPTVSAFKDRLAFYEAQNGSKSRAKAEAEETSRNPASDDEPHSEVWALLQNYNFSLLFIGFTLALAHLNSLAVLLNQLPGDYSNATVGLVGAALILTGFFGAFLTGFVLEWTKAYQTVLKAAYTLSLIGIAVFLSNCRDGNATGLIISGGFLGFAILPIVPSSIVNSVETVYPLSGDLAVGMLYSSANILAVPFTFIGQVLLSFHGGSAPFFAYGIWLMVTMIMGWLPVMFFKGTYSRLREDERTGTRQDDEAFNRLIIQDTTVDTQII